MRFSAVSHELQRQHGVAGVLEGVLLRNDAITQLCAEVHDGGDSSNEEPERPPDKVDRNPMTVQRWIEREGAGVVVDEGGVRIEVRTDCVCFWFES